MSRKKLILLGIIILILVFFPGYSKLQKLKAKNRSLLTRIDELEKENVRLTHEIKRLEDDPFYIEKKARDKMGMDKKGEIRYKVIYGSEESND